MISKSCFQNTHFKKRIFFKQLTQIHPHSSLNHVDRSGNDKIYKILPNFKYIMYEERNNERIVLSNWNLQQIEHIQRPY